MLYLVRLEKHLFGEIKANKTKQILWKSYIKPLRAVMVKFCWCFVRDSLIQKLYTKLRVRNCYAAYFQWIQNEVTFRRLLISCRPYPSHLLRWDRVEIGGLRLGEEEIQRVRGLVVVINARIKDPGYKECFDTLLKYLSVKNLFSRGIWAGARILVTHLSQWIRSVEVITAALDTNNTSSSY